MGAVRSIRKIEYKHTLKWNIILVLAAGVFLVAGLFWVSNQAASQEIKRQVSEANASAVKLYLQIIDERFTGIEKELMNLILNNNDVITIESGSDEDKVQLSNDQLLGFLNELNSIYNDLDGLFYYNLDRGRLLCNDSSGSSSAVKSELRSYLTDQIRTDHEDIYDSWAPYEVSGQYYFIRYIRSGKSVVGTFVRVDKFLDVFRSATSGEFSHVLFVDERGNPLSHDERLEKARVDVSNQDQEFEIRIDGEQHIGVSQKTQKGSYFLIGLNRKQEMLAGLNRIKLLHILFCGGALAAGVWLYFGLNERLTKPVQHILDGMNQLEEGEWNTQISADKGYRELQTIAAEFNEMAGQIRKLKINVYEEQIRKQDARLKYLQLQINPHFFTNSLNVIYSLTVTKNLELIKKLVMLLTRHTRYTLRAGSALVMLQEELDFIHNYLEIQKIRFYYQLEVNLNIAKELMEIRIPPMVLQTFVENTTKYGVEDEKRIHLSITGERRKKGNCEYLYLCIEDRGNGYPEHILEGIYSQEVFLDKDGEEHYGITNALQRLDLTYKTERSVVISNREEGGARTELWIPV